MKFSTTIKVLSLSFGMLLALNACKKCKKEDPRARIINNGTDKASVQIKTTGGNTTNINNIQVGTTSAYSSYSAGIVTYTVNVANTDYVKTVDMAKCYEYDIVVNSDNSITSVPTDRNK
jgi:hypothetical protein